MHKGVILLTKAENREDAISNADEFLREYGDGNVWDWYRVGGRWSNHLAPEEKLEEYDKQMKELVGYKEGDFGIGTNKLEENSDRLIEIWKSLGLKGKPVESYGGGFAFGLADEGEEYDVLPLSECVKEVNNWIRDVDKEAAEYFDKIIEEREKEKGIGHGTMSAYYAGKYRDSVYNNFCFDSNVYDITAERGERLPEDMDGYWAVMIDMHN